MAISDRTCSCTRLTTTTTTPVTGLNNGAICTPEEEIKDEEDEDNDFAEAER